MVATPKKPAGTGRPAPARQAGVASKPSLCFQYPKSLHRKTLALLDKMERAPDPCEHSHALADIVVALVSSGMEAYFMDPLKAAKVDFLTRQSASLGLSANARLMAAVIHNIVGQMDASQLLSICASIRQFMH